MATNVKASEASFYYVYNRHVMNIIGNIFDMLPDWSTGRHRVPPGNLA